jgi:hypothetical protein
MSKNRILQITLIPAGILVASVSFFVVKTVITTIIAIVVFAWPTNSRDNADPTRRTEMAQITREWGQLAPFPKTAQDFTIYTEGNSFTRTFRGSFTDTPENIKAWLDNSKGVKEGKTESPNHYILKMGGGANYGEVIVSPDGTTVTFRVSWS